MPSQNTLHESVKTLARTWQLALESGRKKDEKRLHLIMGKMLENPRNKVFLIELLDQSFRSDNPERVADQLEYLFAKYDTRSFFSTFEQLLIWLFRHVGIYLPSVSVPLFIRYLREDVSTIVIKGEETPLIRHIRARALEGTRVNINIIGEMVIGEREAEERVVKYIMTLQHPDIDYISIKISTIFSQITPLAHAWSVARIGERLERIYRAAMLHLTCKNEPKFVNLDMEEYRDLALTIDAFTQTLEKPEFHTLHAGIVIQTYLPDAMKHIEALVAWTKHRVANGGAPVKIRLVKGANGEMEQTEASLRGWECVTYESKAQTDANFKRAVELLLTPETAPAVHVGIASHNLFDHAHAWLWAKQQGVERYHSAEMLEGMSEAAYEVLKKEGMNVILYAPTATKETFTNAIAYLVRRFDENTAEQNFLRHSFGLHADTPEWETLLQSYEDSLALMPTLSEQPRRVQDRSVAQPPERIDTQRYRFSNEPDTDFALEANRLWAEGIVKKWKHIGAHGGYHAAPVIAGSSVETGTRIRVMDPSQYYDNVEVGSVIRADTAQLRRAVDTGAADPDGWRQLGSEARQKILMQVADEFRKARADLIGIAAAEVGKTFGETDVEVSEAIDFLNFYPYSVRKLEALENITATGKGLGLVISPWNFPIAIPTGGIAAALASGNCVILKPASEAALCAQRLCECFWAAGVSRNVLQFAPCSGETASAHLVADARVDFVIFTGGEQTAYRILQTRPDIHLSAETGGKDATIVTAMADREQAVKNVVASAFNNSGQKCSATSLLVLEREVYEDAHFKATLEDAAASLQVGSVWELHHRIGALSHPPAGALQQALEGIEPHESWLIPPVYANENPYMLRPAIRWGTQQGDFCHMNELFGPVLSVMCAENLEEAIAIVNATGYGLTSGLESLDLREQEFWQEHLKAGNLYINRMTTGAIVLRQPFGGMGLSAIGSGRKAGGFNYVAQFMNISHPAPTAAPDPMATAQEIAGAFRKVLETEFMRRHDYVNVRGESNEIRYLPLRNVLLRIEESDAPYAVLSSIMAIRMSGAALSLSLSQSVSQTLEQQARTLLGNGDTLSRDTEAQLCKKLLHVSRVRFLNPSHVTQEHYKAASKRGIHIASEPFVAEGRIELMHYFIEQSISNSYHRYGNLGIHALES